ncbi:MAG: D-glycero-beta-D-manno-heptose 1-phosphate adenylyltransferase [Pseudomonadota bacterium]|nr:D-glycero-beta-D-manno-heptose 1-phosphate adenylyltransferase [Pseudomonadota bacterium]
MGQVLNLQDLQIALTQKRKNKKVIFTNGCFDILHAGHVTYLDAAKALGDILVVGINSDESVKSLKGPTRPIQCEEDRAKILAALVSVDYVVVFGEDTPKDLIKKLEPDILVKGGDWPVDKIVGADFVKSRGGLIKSLPFVEGKSSSAIIEKVRKL